MDNILYNDSYKVGDKISANQTFDPKKCAIAQKNNRTFV